MGVSEVTKNNVLIRRSILFTQQMSVSVVQNLFIFKAHYPFSCSCAPTRALTFPCVGGFEFASLLGCSTRRCLSGDECMENRIAVGTVRRSLSGVLKWNVGHNNFTAAKTSLTDL